MSRIFHIGIISEHQVYVFRCPGCGFPHNFRVPGRTWNGDFDIPTIDGEIYINRDDDKTRCIALVNGGKISFHKKCWHNLAGKTVEIPEW